LVCEPAGGYVTDESIGLPHELGIHELLQLVVDVVDKESDVFRRKVGFDCSHVPQRGVRRQSAAERERTPMNAVARSRWAWHPQCDAPCRRMTWRFDILGIARRVSPARAAGAARGHTRISAGTARGTGPQK
jgi:hypothetical protein